LKKNNEIIYIIFFNVILSFSKIKQLNKIKILFHIFFEN
jgi:hypothetical protein